MNRTREQIEMLMKVKWKNLKKALESQGSPKQFIRKLFITRNAWGMFSINSHVRKDTGKLKIMYPKKSKAKLVAKIMGRKNNTVFSAYKCVFCDGYHIGRNSDNKVL